MNELFKIPPRTISQLTTPEKLTEYFAELIGRSFPLTGKTRTDGSNLRKLIASILFQNTFPELAQTEQYEILPPKRKGVPKILSHLIDTYLITSGESYNLQVWNRIPGSNSLLVKYENGESLRCIDVRFVLVKIDIKLEKITSVLIMTPDYIEKKFGVFGKPTIKHQLLISRKVRKSIIESPDKIFSLPDSKKIAYYIRHDYQSPDSGLVSEPTIDNLFSIALILSLVAKDLIGYKLDSGPTKNRGQALERKVSELLGYKILENDLLHGAFPDIKNQLLEVKVQDTQTVDLGRFSPAQAEPISSTHNFTTFDVRYLIALTNPKTEIIEGLILSPGERLGEIFSYVSAVESH
jgi:hypothetical protein